MSIGSVLEMLVKVFASVALLWSGLSLAYQYVLAVAGRKPLPERSRASNFLKLAVLIPAHDEATVIASTVNAVRQSDYPSDRYDTFVIADNCSDATAEEARAAGAKCLERAEEPRGRKAYPLKWAIDQVLAPGHRYDGVVVIDADSQLDVAFLSRMSDALSSGHAVLQGRHLLSNVGASLFTLVADADMRINNLLRNHAKQRLGLSARLMGDAMCFSREVLETFGWPVDSLGEDREFGVYLVSRGYRVHYVPEAVSRGQAPLRWRDASAQRLRWQAGARQVQRRQLGGLLRAAFNQRSVPALDLAAELLLPSYTVAAATAAGALVVLAFIRDPSAGALGWAALVQLSLAAAFPFLALALAQAPRSSFMGALMGPAFLAWRLAHKIRAAISPDSVKWVRTVRSEEIRS
ncbi:MAG: glycosyltransferase [Chloroflexi bacterium]|nr:glycosyltransferase [Chloroflexota bacterium]